MTKDVSNISEFIFDKPLPILSPARGVRLPELNFSYQDEHPRFAACFGTDGDKPNAFHNVIPN